MNWKRHLPSRRGGRLLCLLFAALMAAGWARPARGEATYPPINESGNLNLPLSVDPLADGAGYSAVLYDSHNGLPTSEANAIAQTSEGFIWIGSYAGLIRYDGNTFEHVDAVAGLANVRCLFVDSQDRLWIGTNDAGLFLMDHGTFRQWNKEDGLGSLSIRAITEDTNGVIYAASVSGITLLDKDMHLTILEDDRIAGQTFTGIRRSGDGLVYGISNTGNIDVLKDGKPVFHLESDDFPIEQPLEILPDPERPGFLYIGTEHFVCHGSLEQGFDAWEVWNVSPLLSMECLECIDGRLWVCARTGIGTLEGGEIRPLQGIPMNNSFHHVMTDSEGNLWIASARQGVMKIVPNRFIDLFDQCGLPAEVVNSTCMLGGRLFIGAENGLIVIEGGQRLSQLPLTGAATAAGDPIEAADLLEFLDGIRIRSIIRDSKDRLWISTGRDRGLIRYDRGEITQFTEADGLLSDSIRVVSECEDGSLLVATSNGINVIEGDRVSQRYGPEEGISVQLILTITEGYRHEWLAGSDGGGIYVISADGTKRIGAEDGLSSDIIMRIRRSRTQDLYWIVTGNCLACMTPDYQVRPIMDFTFVNNYDLYENSNGDLWILGSSGIYVIPAGNLRADSAEAHIDLGVANGLSYMATANSYSELTPNGDLYISGHEGVVKVNIDEPLEYTGEIKLSLPYLEADGARVFPDGDGSFTIPGNTRKLTLYPFVINYSMINPQVFYRLEGFDAEDTAIRRSELVPVYYTNLANGVYRFMMRVKDPMANSDGEVSFRIVKGKESSIGNAGSIIMDAASLFFMGGLLIYTALYRKRGRLDDRLFFAMIVTNIVLAVADALTYLVDGSGYAGTRPVMILGNLAFFAAFEIFPYLFLLYLDYRAYQDRERIRKYKLWYLIPGLAILLLLPISLQTGWIFSVDAEGVYHSGPWNDLVFLPVMIYFIASLIRVRKINIRLVALGVLLILARVAWGIWFREISSTALTYTLFLICTHIHVMNRPLIEEAP